MFPVFVSRRVELAILFAVHVHIRTAQSRSLGLSAAHWICDCVGYWACLRRSGASAAIGSTSVIMP